MGLFVKLSDFYKGDIRIAQDSSKEIDLEECIGIIEEETLQELFGSELYQLFLDDFNAPTAGQPTDPRFIDVYDKFYDDTDSSIAWCGRSYRSEGIKKMLMRFIWVKFTNDQPILPTSSGPVKADRNNAVSASNAQTGMSAKYNIGVTSYQAIARKMILDSDTYPEYNGIAKGKTSMI